MEFNFCAVCGSGLQEILLLTEERPRLVCPDCGHIHYINPKVVSGTLPVQDGKVWLLRRGIEPRLGYWTHPAGFQERDESTSEAAVRETYEELACQVEVTALLGVYSRPNAPVVNVVYLAQLSEGSPQPSTTPEATEIALFDMEELPWADLAFESTALALRDWQSGLLAP
ncbi:MAG: NUDIX hydrolase [Chloroflexota bacterium]|nr:NUDIX hydrolase [Chloroflexota bacterium]